MKLDKKKIEKLIDILESQKLEKDLIINLFEIIIKNGVPVKLLSIILGLTPRRINQLVDEKVLIKNNRDCFDLLDCCNKYIEYLKGFNVDTPSLTEEKIKLVKLQIAKMEIEVDELRGHLLPAEYMEKFFKNIIVNAKTRILGIRSDIKMKVPEISNDILKVVYEVCKKTLDELSRTKLPKTFK